MSVNDKSIGLYSLDKDIQAAIHEAVETAFDINIYEQLEDVLQVSPQLLIIDLIHSGTDGYQLCKKIRQQPMWTDIPLLALTRDTSRTVSLALTAGFDDCIFLPINGALLQHRLIQALKHYELSRNARRYRNLVAHTKDAVVVVSPDETLCIHEWNEAAENIYGWSAQDAIGKELGGFIPTTYFSEGSRKVALQAAAENHFWEDEVLQLNKDGNQKRIHISAAAVVDDDNRIIEYISVNRDITATHEAEVALKQSEERLSSILAAIPELVLVLDRDGQHCWVVTEDHPALLLPASQLINYKLHDLLDKKQADNFLTCIHQALNTGEPAELEYTLNIKGELRWFRATVVKLDADRVVWVAYDVSEQKASEKALQESSNSYRHLFEAANDAIFLVDVETGQIAEANRQACRLLGYKIDELIGLAIEAIEVPDDDNSNDTLTATMGNTNRLIFEQLYRCKDGRIITVESSSRITRYRGKMGILSFARDITVRKQMETAEREQRLLAEALRDTAAAFNSTLEHDEVLDLILEYVNRVVVSEASEILLIDDDGYVTIRRHRGYLATGVTLEDIQQIKFKADSTENMRWMIEHRESLHISDVNNYEGWQSHPDVGWTQSMLSAPIIIKGEVAGFINLLSSETSVFDSTQIDRLQAFANQAAIAIHNAALFESTQQFAIEKEREVLERTAALEDERNLLQTLIDNLPDHVYVKDRESRFLLANQALVDFLGLGRLDALNGKTDMDLKMLENALELYEQEQILMASGIPLLDIESRRTGASGEMYWLLTSKVPLRDASGEIIGLVGINRDITAIRQAEDRLMRVLKSIRCLLWYASVEEVGGIYTWNLYIANEEAAAEFLPVAKSSDDYTAAWLASILPEDHVKRQIMLETNLRFNRPYSLELRCRQPDGSIRWLVEDVQIQSATEGHWNLVGICTDITARKTAENELQAAHDTLETRVAARTRELLQTNETLTQEINERRRAESAEREQRILAEALRDSSVAINRHTQHIETALDEILNVLRDVVPHESSMITLLDDNTLRIVGRYGRILDMSIARLSIEGMINLQQILTTGESLAIDDVRRFAGWVTLPDEAWIRANLVIPILLDEEIVGFLHLNSEQPGQFMEQDIRRLEGFASQVSIAIRNERLMDEIHQHAAELEKRVNARTADLTQKTAELEAILNAMRDGVVYYDLDAVPQYINQAMSDITQYSNEMWLSGQAEPALLNIPLEDDDDFTLKRQPHDTILSLRGKRILDRQGFWQTEMLLQRQDESLFDAGIICAEVRDDTGTPIGMVMVLRDISESKQLEEQKKQFIASASHELRTPITNMKTRLYLMRRQPERFDEHIEVAESVVNWMRHLVETMFDISRFEQGIIVLQHEVFPLQDLLLDVYNDHVPHADNAKISLIYTMPDDPVHYRADRSRLRQVLTNLVSNALYYTPQNGSVRIEMDVAEDDIYIRVIDDGAGIPEAAQERLFEPFYRAHDDNKGAGLGLSIAHDIISKHDGEISISSMVNRGSTFTIRLPAKQVEIDSAK